MKRYLKIDQVSKTFTRGSQETVVLKDIELSVEKGEYVSIIGHSGCGKSTLLNIVAGLITATTGGVLLEDREVDEPVAGMSAHEREETGELLRRVGADRTIVVIEHDMDFVRRYADHVTVMHAGRILAEGSVTQVQADPRVQEVYLGHAADELPDEEAAEALAVLGLGPEAEQVVHPHDTKGAR